MSFWNMVGLLFTVSLFAFVLYYLNKGKHDKFEKTQDLVRFKQIDDDGMIEFSEGIFRAAIEVEAVNMFLKSPEEQKTVWMQFREMLSALHVPIIIIVQSRHRDIKAYVAGLRESSTRTATGQLQAYGQELARHIESEIQDRKIKDHRYYIVLEVDPNLRKTELDIPNPTIARLAAGFQKKLSSQEAKDLARQELHDNIGIIASYLKTMGLNVFSMNKHAVLEMGYAALNRDLAPVASYAGIIDAGTIQATSLTLEVVNSQKTADNPAPEPTTPIGQEKGVSSHA